MKYIDLTRLEPKAEVGPGGCSKGPMNLRTYAIECQDDFLEEAIEIIHKKYGYSVESIREMIEDIED